MYLRQFPALFQDLLHPYRVITEYPAYAPMELSEQAIARGNETGTYVLPSLMMLSQQGVSDQQIVPGKSTETAVQCSFAKPAYIELSYWQKA